MSARDMLEYNPFERAPFLERLKEHKAMVVLDYDHTLTTGSISPNRQELNDQEDVWRITAEASAVDACISARTPGMMMDTERYVDSLANGYTEPLPRLFKNPVSGKYEYADPASMPFYKNAVNREIICSFGGGILVKNGKGYRVDKAYEQMLSLDAHNRDERLVEAEPGFDLKAPPVKEAHTPSIWRLAAMTFIHDYCREFHSFLSSLENSEHYRNHKTNVAPLPYRVQFTFEGTQGYQRLLELKRVIKREKELGNPFALRLHLIDESYIDEEHPEKSRYTLYVVPWHGRKENMYNRILVQSSKASGLASAELDLYYAGDSLTDLKVGLWGGGDAATKFLLPTNSFLAPYIMDRRRRYGAVDLSLLWEDPVKRRLQPRLMPTGRTGEYRFVHKVRGGRNNTVVIGNERYPNLTAPGSVAAFLEEYLLKKQRASP